MILIMISYAHYEHVFLCSSDYALVIRQDG